MEKYHIPLTAEESALLAKIDLQRSHPNHDDGYEAYKTNKQPILALVKLLRERHAVPEVRLKYWEDPKYRTGRIKVSRKGLFERKGCVGAEIYTHPHFIPHLRYFLFGTELPDAVIQAFEQKVGNPEFVSSSDVVRIGQHARDLTREYHLNNYEASEEFFKLSLDMGLSLYIAQSVMRSVRQVPV